MEIRVLRYFLEIARAGNMSRGGGKRCTFPNRRYPSR